MKLNTMTTIAVLILSILLTGCIGGGSSSSSGGGTSDVVSGSPGDTSDSGSDDSSDSSGNEVVVKDSRLEVLKEETDQIQVNRIDMFSLASNTSVPENDFVDVYAVQADDSSLEYDWNIESNYFVSAMSALSLHTDDGTSYDLISIGMNSNDDMMTNAGRCAVDSDAKVHCEVLATDHNAGTGGVQTTDISDSMTNSTGSFEVRAEFCTSLGKCIEVSLGEVTIHSG